MTTDDVGGRKNSSASPDPWTPISTVVLCMRPAFSSGLSFSKVTFVDKWEGVEGGREGGREGAEQSRAEQNIKPGLSQQNPPILLGGP